jgi:hypothetical protein
MYIRTVGSFAAAFNFSSASFGKSQTSDECQQKQTGTLDIKDA